MIRGQRFRVNQRWRENWGSESCVGSLGRPRLGRGAVDKRNSINKCIQDGKYSISFPGKSGACRTKGVSICLACPWLFWGPNESLRKESKKKNSYQNKDNQVCKINLEKNIRTIFHYIRFLSSSIPYSKYIWVTPNALRLRSRENDSPPLAWETA